MSMGYTHQTWTKELDDKLIGLIKKDKKLTSISVTMKMSIHTIERRLKALGYDGIKDAREELIYLPKLSL